MDAAPEGADGAAESALELAAPAHTAGNQGLCAARACNHFPSRVALNRAASGIQGHRAGYHTACYKVQINSNLKCF